MSNAGGHRPTVDTESEAIDHLYSLAQSEFTAARNELVSSARAAGQHNLATAIKALRKPSTLAAELNRLLRLHPDLVERLLETALALRDGHRSVLGGHEADLSALQREHREAAAKVAASAKRDEARLQTLLEAASLDTDCHHDLQTAAYVTEPNPTLGFDLFSPPPPTAAPGRAEAEAQMQRVASLHAKTEAELTLARRQAEAAANKHARAAERLAAAEREAVAAHALLKRTEIGLAAARSRTELAEKARSSSAEALREAQARLTAKKPAEETAKNPAATETDL